MRTNEGQHDVNIPSPTLSPRDSKNRSVEDEGCHDAARSTFASDGVPARIGAKKRPVDDEYGNQDEHRTRKADTPMQTIEV